MLKDLICAIKGCDFQEWDYESENSCEQIRVCRRNPEHIEHKRTLLHDFGPVKYESDDSCRQIRVCKRNPDHVEHLNINHDFGPVKYESGDSCRQIRVCRRNPDHVWDQDIISHDFGTWKYESDDSCKQIRVCKRNPDHIETKETHNFSYPMTECTKCGYVKKYNVESATKEEWVDHRCPECADVGGIGAPCPVCGHREYYSSHGY